MNLLIDKHTGMPAVCDYGDCKNEEGVDEIYEHPEMKPTLRCPEHKGLCNAIMEFTEIPKRCGKPATEHDTRFRYPLCVDCAHIAHECMDIDDQMLANAY